MSGLLASDKGRHHVRARFRRAFEESPVTVRVRPCPCDFLQIVARREDRALRRDDDDMDAGICCQLIRSFVQTVDQHE